MGCVSKYNILIVDDNPFPTRESCCILIEKLGRHFNISNENKNNNLSSLQSIYSNDYSGLKHEFEKIIGENKIFHFNNNATLTIFNYDPRKSKKSNQEIIINIIKNNKINIFWTDRGHSNFKVEGDEMYEVTGRYNSKADELYGNSLIINELKENGIMQIAMYSYNPEFTLREREKLRKKIFNKFDKILSEDNIYIIETSTTLNLFEEENKLYNGLPETELLGSLNAYKYYGKLLGNILYDLFLQIDENKKGLTIEQKRYNYFNPKNRSFLDYLILINNKIDKGNGIDLKVGLISFYGDSNGGKNFLLDVPYKEYYYIYDTHLNNNNNAKIPISSIFELKDNYSEGFLYLKYVKISQKEYNFNYKSVNLQNNIKKLAPKYLPLLHTAIFYQPDFYELDQFPFNYFKKNTKLSFSSGEYCEIFYFIKKYSNNGIIGDIHFALWRKKHCTLDYKADAIKAFDYYYPLIESKAQESIFPLLMEQITQQATRAAISQVMARNMSHNIGSHVLSRLVTPDTLKTLFEACSDNDTLFKLYQPLFTEKIEGNSLFANLNTYQKTRMDFLADVTFGEPAMENSRLLCAEILKELDDNRLLLENISGTDNFFYQFVVRNCTNCDKACCSENNTEGCADCENCIINIDNKNDIQVSMPNDILGYHALFLIIENIIRNCAKHSGVNTDSKKRLKIYIDIKENKDVPDFYEVHIYDSNEVGKEKLNELVKNQNITINKDVLENNSLRQGGWGLIEMEAAAAYLRKQPIEYINDDKYNIDVFDENSICSNDGSKDYIEPNFLKAINVRDKHYGYRLFLLKPKELLVVYDENLKENLNGVLDYLNNVEQTKKGIKTVALKEMQTTLEVGKVFAYPLMVYIGSTSNYNCYILPNATALPNRVLWYPENEENKHLNTRFVHTLNNEEFKGLNLDTDDSINHCWKTWILKQNEFLDVGIYKNRFFKDDLGLYNGKYTLDLGYFKESNFNNNYNVKFEDHGVATMLGNLAYETHANPFYTEPYNSKDKFILSKLVRLNGDNGECLTKENFKSFCKLIEATTTCIHILDERIQELAEKTWYYSEANLNLDSSKLLFTDVLYASKVVVPLTSEQVESKRINKSQIINLNQNAYKDSCADIIKYINSIVKHTETDNKSLAREKADFLLIHLGIIEKLIEAHKQANSDKTYNKEADGVKQFIEEVLLENEKNVATKIIIISGRGKPHNMPKNYLYLNFSLVSQYCIENRLKYLLNEVVFSSKKIK